MASRWPATVLHGSAGAQIDSTRRLASGDADGLQAPELEHAVRGLPLDRGAHPFALGAFRPSYGAGFMWEKAVPFGRALAFRRPSRFRYTSSPSITRCT